MYSDYMARYLRATVTALTVILAMILTSGSAVAQACPEIIPNGKAYEKLAADWWKWAYSFPVSINPLFDETGANAYLGDRGNVFFLGGVYNESGSAIRTITVPAGKPIFFPLLNVVWDNVDVRPPYLGGPFPKPATFNPMSPKELEAVAAGMISMISDLNATIDGCPVPDPFSYRAKSAPFSYRLPAQDNLLQLFGYNVSGVIAPAVADGYWLFLPPLQPGQHTIRFGGTIPDFNFTLDITYYITVE